MQSAKDVSDTLEGEKYISQDLAWLLLKGFAKELEEGSVRVGTLNHRRTNRRFCNVISSRLHAGAQQCHTVLREELQKRVFNAPPDKCMLLSLKLNPTITKPTVANSKAFPETAILSAYAVELIDTAYSSEMRRVAAGIY